MDNYYMFKFERNPLFQMGICLIGWFYVISCLAKAEPLAKSPAGYSNLTFSDKFAYNCARVIRNSFCRIIRIINQNLILKLITTTALSAGMVWFLQNYTM